MTTLLFGLQHVQINSDLIETWIPIIIAVIALVTSIISTSITRRSFNLSHRPYVWSSSFRDNKTVKEIPEMVMMINSNSPAKILRQDFTIKLGDEELYHNEKKGQVRYPSERMQWSYQVTTQRLREFVLQAKSKPDLSLIRINYIEYSSLDGGKKYFHELIQKYNIEFNRWMDESERGS